MNSRWLLIGSSVVAALGVLALSLWLGPSTMPEAEIARPAPPAEPVPGADHEADLAPPFDPDRVISRERFTDTQFFDDVGGGYTLIEGERRIITTWQAIDPRPQGVSDVTDPSIWVFLDELRVLRIVADEGTLVAPGNEPREGQLRGNVALTLYDAREHERIDLASLRDVQFQVFLDDAEFDLELGHVESDAPVRLVGRRVEFVGRGLRLTYNELRNRIERLEVAKGDSLRFRSNDQAAAPTAPLQARAAHPVRLAALGDPTIHLVNDDDAPADVPVNDDEATQFYHASFRDAVRVTVGQHEMDMAADQLEVVFSFEADPGAAAPSAPSAPPTPDRETDANANSVPIHFAAARTPSSAPAHDDADAELFTQHPDDVVVRWSGALLMLPIDQRPSDFAGPEDVLLTLTGQPATVHTEDEQTIEGRTIDYLTSTGRLRAQRDAHRPVRLTGPRFGTLTGDSLLINQHLGIGHVLGPGTLAAPLNGAATAAATATATDVDADALRIAWVDRLDLTFYLESPRSGERGPRISGLRSADFQGQVEAHHPEFDLRTDRLNARLSAPANADDRQAGAQTLRRIDAVGEVALLARPANQPPLELDSDELRIDLVRDHRGGTRPERITAHGDVRTRQPEQRLWARQLELAFALEPRDEPTSDAAPHGEIERMVAEGDVRIELDDPATELAGHRVVAEVAADQVELFGAPGANGRVAELARVVQADAVLAGEHIVMRQSDRVVNVDGRGWFEARLASDAPADEPGEDLPDELRVTWARAMRYDDQAGHARFLGDVRADTRDARSRAWLTTDDLQLRLTDAARNANGERADTTATATAPAHRRIDTATAQGDARFTAEQLDESGRWDTRLRMEGPLMSFEGETERVQVIGAGRMFIEDRRPAPAQERADRADGADQGPGPAGIRFSGRGQTLFLWERQLTLDAPRNDVLMEQTVQMLHRPAGETGVVQLDAQRLLMHFAEPDAPDRPDGERAGGLAGWGGQGGPDPVIDLIRAGGAVRILHGPRTVTSDHLQYTRADQRVRLWAEPGSGHLVRVHRADQPTGLSAEQVIWELDRDRFEATDLGPGIIPLPQ